MHEARIAGAQLREFAGVRRGAEDHGAGGSQRLQDIGELAVAQRADDDEIVRELFVFFPEIAAKHGDSGSLAFGLPTGGQRAARIRFHR